MGSTLLGEGEGAKIYALDAHRVMKIFKSTAKFEHEVRVLRKLRAIGVGPQATLGPRANSLVMPRLYPITRADLSAPSFQRALVRQVVTMVDHGLLHNDLHVGNIMRSRARTPVIVDFDLAKTVRPPRGVVLDQLVLAQLYAIIDPANTHNHLSPKWLHHTTEALVNGPIVNTIYAIRQGKTAR